MNEARYVEGARWANYLPPNYLLAQQIYFTNFCCLHLRLMYNRMSQMEVQTKQLCSI